MLNFATALLEIHRCVLFRLDRMPWLVIDVTTRSLSRNDSGRDRMPARFVSNQCLMRARAHPLRGRRFRIDRSEFIGALSLTSPACRVCDSRPRSGDSLKDSAERKCHALVSRFETRKFYFRVLPFFLSFFLNLAGGFSELNNRTGRRPNGKKVNSDCRPTGRTNEPRRRSCFSLRDA